MTRSLLFTFLIAALYACSPQTGTSSNSTNKNQSKFENQDPTAIVEVATDKTYGHESNNPIKVGGITANSMVQKEILYLNILAGPEGQDISFTRIGSCCMTPSENATFGQAMLDKYQLKWDNEIDTLYINMYDPGVLKIPYRFTAKN